MAAELSYPVTEGVTAGLLSFIFNLNTLIVLFLASRVPLDWQNTVLTAVICGCGIMTCVVREKYLRRQHSVLQEKSAA